MEKNPYNFLVVPPSIWVWTAFVKIYTWKSYRRQTSPHHGLPTCTLYIHKFSHVQVNPIEGINNYLFTYYCDHNTQNKVPLTYFGHVLLVSCLILDRQLNIWSWKCPASQFGGHYNSWSSPFVLHHWVWCKTPCREKVYMGTDKRVRERSVRWHLGYEK